MITLRYFASLRERLECDTEQLDLPEGVGRVSALRDHLAARGGEFARLAASEGQATARILCAVNQEFAREDTPVRDGDEVAFFPPVTGG